MKTGTNVIVNSGARRIAFVMVCVLIATVGFAARVAISGLDRSQDGMIQDFMQPSQQYLQGASAREKTAVAAAKSAPSIKDKESGPSEIAEKL